ncbi:DNA2/NAM7 helicase family protein [Heterostelium album PN500]|uniref:DNA2/NAM7 helicase family protein n=1 Tax=Heterostelium pallidum (strain ATCC 26659 / Pp 5 / PN500) TaxID=670386 RepID=D3B846_HETP5|nr:DNA2/NAM7 helicase family protein [Heterostelium album PN500]EFA82214.1 DNA2/NAM7 helicase family protein [Heterostelium album PN500]|eukprot:XP_020434331.1 DNA2/NAM7 helicase family protein [Heterostelium album PN500]
MSFFVMSDKDKNNDKDEELSVDPLDKMSNDQIIAQFYRKILAWDVSNLRANEKLLKPVKVEFLDRHDYIDTFEPLLLEECRAQLERSIEEGGEKNDVENEPVFSRVRYISENSDFLDVGLVMTKENEMYQFHENDLMMISLHHPMILFGGDENEEITDDEDPSNVVDRANGASSTGASAAAGEDPDKVYTTEKKKKKVIPPSKIEVTDANRYLHLVGTVEQFEMGGIKREYLALYTTAKTSFMKTLLLADDEEPGVPMKIPPALKEKFESSYNPSQFGALTSALSGSNITLIQGPPGTGKTHVIVGLLSVLLHSTEVPKHVIEEKESLVHRELYEFEKLESWEISQPWLKNGFKNIRDDYTLIDYSFEEKEERRKRDLWRKLRETGTTKNIARKKRILLCAPSNGAVDEIVTRLIRDGLLNHEGKSYRPNLVRVGPGSHQDVEPVTLEYMVRCRQQLMNSNSAIPSSSASTAVATTSPKSSLDTNSIRTLVLEDAEIIATTLSFSGSSILMKMNGFDIVIIDEAAQAVETSTLVPMQHKCKKIVLVGDPKQLPATIISPIAIKQKYDQSLFQRLQEKRTPHMLTTQYRMHSSIRAFPSKHFYNDLLEDGPNIPSRATNYHANPFFGPLIFYDLSFSVETKPGGGSVFNEDECRMALQLYQLLLKTYPDELFSGRIGIISPYRQQVLSLREYFKNYSGISIDTVDGFQGREREIIIFSCVRAPAEKGAGIGFLADVRRMNVALTRPRSSLLIIGNSKSLCINPDWYELIKHAQDNNNLIPITNPSLETIVPTLNNTELFDELSAKGQAVKLVAPSGPNPDDKNLKKDNKRKKTQRKQNNNNNNKNNKNNKKTKNSANNIYTAVTS